MTRATDGEEERMSYMEFISNEVWQEAWAGAVEKNLPVTGNSGEVLGEVSSVGIKEEGITVSVQLNEYGHTYLSPKLIGLSVAKPLTKKQKRRYWRQDQMRKVGRRLYDLANKFGYFHDCEEE